MRPQRRAEHGEVGRMGQQRLVHGRVVGQRPSSASRLTSATTPMLR
jgi:hypothetical protein